jgi:AAA domain
VTDANEVLRQHGPDALREQIDAGRSVNGGRGPFMAEPGRRQFNLVSYSTITVSTANPYLVKGLIPRGGLIVVWGPPKCGKSFWTYDVAMHIALGWDYRGRRVQQGPVVYLALEGGQGFRARIEAFRRRHRVADAEFFLITERTDLIADHSTLVADIRSQGPMPALVVIDTLNRSLAGSENEPKDMAAYVRVADVIREAFGCAVLIVHHCGVDGTRPRGHTSLTGAADAQLAVKRDSANNIVVEVEWMKDGREGDTIVSALQVVEVGRDDDGEAITSCVVMPAEHQSGARATIPKAAKVAYELLCRAITDSPVLMPASNHIPPDSRTTTVSLWRRYCYEGMVAESDNPDTRQKAFVRAVKRLQDAAIIGIWGDYVWITGHAGH